MGDDDDERKKASDKRVPFIKACMQAGYSNIKPDKFDKAWNTEENMCVCSYLSIQPLCVV
jgi:hypothetical protein